MEKVCLSYSQNNKNVLLSNMVGTLVRLRNSLGAQRFVGFFFLDCALGLLIGADKLQSWNACNTKHFFNTVHVLPQVFNFDVRLVDWSNYFGHFILGIKQYLLKEDLGNMHIAQSRIRR